MSQICESLPLPTKFLQELQQENHELQSRLHAQSKVLHSLENRVERSLQTLQTYLDQLKAIGANLGCSDHLRFMEAEINRLCDLLADTTLLQKLEAGKVTVNLAVLEPSTILAAVSRHLVAPRDGSTPRLRCQIADSLPVIYADLELTEAVIADLLSRGLKYSDPEVSVTLGAETEAEQLRIWVTAQRFAPVGQREFAPEIALCCKRIEVQGGEVTCKADENGFSVVSVLLPVLMTESLKVGQLAKAVVH